MEINKSKRTESKTGQGKLCGTSLICDCCKVSLFTRDNCGVIELNKLKSLYSIYSNTEPYTILESGNVNPEDCFKNSPVTLREVKLYSLSVDKLGYIDFVRDNQSENGPIGNDGNTMFFTDNSLVYDIYYSAKFCENEETNYRISFLTSYSEPDRRSVSPGLMSNDEPGMLTYFDNTPMAKISITRWQYFSVHCTNPNISIKMKVRARCRKLTEALPKPVTLLPFSCSQHSSKNCTIAVATTIQIGNEFLTRPTEEFEEVSNSVLNSLSYLSQKIPQARLIPSSSSKKDEFVQGARGILKEYKYISLSGAGADNVWVSLVIDWHPNLPCRRTDKFISIDDEWLGYNREPDINSIMDLKINFKDEDLPECVINISYQSGRSILRHIPEYQKHNFILGDEDVNQIIWKPKGPHTFSIKNVDCKASDIIIFIKFIGSDPTDPFQKDENGYEYSYTFDYL